MHETDTFRQIPFFMNKITSSVNISMYHQFTQLQEQIINQLLRKIHTHVPEYKPTVVSSKFWQ